MRFAPQAESPSSPLFSVVQQMQCLEVTVFFMDTLPFTFVPFR